MGRGLLPPLLPNIIDDLAITSTKAGFAITLMWGIYALGQFPSGRLSDLLSRKTLLVVGLGFLAIGFFTISGTESYLRLLGGAGIIGVGAGLYPSAARALVSDLFVERRGQAFGLHTASGDLGNATAAGLAVAVVAVATWQTAFLPLVVLSCGTLLAVHLWNREKYIFKTVPLKIQSTFWRFFEDDHLRRLLISYSLFAFTWQSTAGFLPTFLQFEKGFSVGLASAAFALVFIIGTLIKPVSGYVGDTFGRVKIGIGSLLLGMSGIVCVLMFESTLLILIGIGIFALGLMAYPPVMQAFVMDVFPDESMGGDLGAMRTMYIGIGSLGPTYVGYVASFRTYTIAFAGLVLCLLASAVILLTATLGNAVSDVEA
jgi:MFS family permease